MKSAILAGATAIGVFLTGCSTKTPSVQTVKNLPAPSVQAPAPALPLSPPGRPDLILDGPYSQGGIVLGTAPSDTQSMTLDGTIVSFASDGRFILGFNRDAPPTSTLIVTRINGQKIIKTLEISPRAWRLEQLNQLARFPKPSAEFTAIRDPELALIANARAINNDSNGWRQKFIWPAKGRISGWFGSQRVYRGQPGAFHSGVDIALPIGTPFFAPADGVVILAADRSFSLEGNLLMIDHGMGLNSAFLHLSRIDVKTGERVKQGQMLGAIGTTGRSTGPHLHWGMKWNDARIDPMLLAGTMQE